ncbi:unnamed protein product [Cuscuta epithymum]|uniref:Leucine-rich repeat-containing N-terminal plant-type domain-containing protein n=1 Tax=Cuscuta epithymum TaxID=186058 RepID=A0AAV0C2V4_9ASTE|nr:unnamed protein product [Cuscuta epithymum]
MALQGDGVMAAASSRLSLLLVAAAMGAIIRCSWADNLTDPDHNIMNELKSGLIFRPNSSVYSVLSGPGPCPWGRDPINMCNKVDDEGTLRVTRVNISSQAAGGTLPLNLKNLTKLELFDASNNNLTGAIPKFADSLIFLSLHTNNLSGEIPDLSHLNQLTHLDISNNQLTNGVPPSIEALINLKYLNLSNNKLTGSIPHRLTRLTALETLDLSNNRLSGLVPQFNYSLGEVITCGNLLLSGEMGKPC